MISTQSILDAARDQGFSLASLLPYRCADPEHLRAWLLEARHASLDYMHEHPRHDPLLLMQRARTLLVTATSYNHPSPYAYGRLKIARYAHNLDYHATLRQRLERLAHHLFLHTGASISWRCATDSAPLLERPLAQTAGLGWIGKNTMLIHPRLGSYTLLAELLIDLPLDDLEPPPPQPDRCGSCSRCLTACPTNALASPYLLDARRCISTWTIESSGPIPLWIRPLIGDMLFGCDICQQVCPWNTKPHATLDASFLPDRDAPSLDPADVLRLTSRQFNRIFQHSPLMRAGRNGLARNAAVVLGNAANPDHLPLLLQRCAVEHADIVRGHIAWALSHFPTHDDARAALERLHIHDPSPYVRHEARHALESTGALAFSPDQLYHS